MIRKKAGKYSHPPMVPSSQGAFIPRFPGSICEAPDNPDQRIQEDVAKFVELGVLRTTNPWESKGISPGNEAFFAGLLTTMIP